jgi:hypothetical protein
MIHLPFVAHFFSPARRLAPLPLRSGRLRIAANLMAAFSSLVKGGSWYGFSFSGAGASPYSRGKSWMLHDDFIEQII